MLRGAAQRAGLGPSGVAGTGSLIPSVLCSVASSSCALRFRYWVNVAAEQAPIRRTLFSTSTAAGVKRSPTRARLVASSALARNLSPSAQTFLLPRLSLASSAPGRSTVLPFLRRTQGRVRFYCTEPPKKPEGQPGPPQLPQLVSLGLITLGGLLAFSLLSPKTIAGSREIDFQAFVTDFLSQGNVAQLRVESEQARVYVLPKNNTTNGHSRYPYYFTIADVPQFEKNLEEAQASLGIDPFDYVPITFPHQRNLAQELFIALLPTMILIFLLFQTMKMTKGGMFSFGASKATVFNQDMKVKTTFADVAGMEEAKQEIMEFVSFLKQPEKYKALGAKIPKGALLVGPPGTGKTLLAKATAGEAGVPFFSISGSDFIELFVGVGPSRVRDLFKQARAKAPSIIFIDEIDAVGRARSKSGFSNDERENTLNQLLVEMDGFSPSTNVVVLAGTNRPDVLDEALLRPGRFDRQVHIDLPDLKERKAIYEVHLKPLKLKDPPESYSKRLATLTPGFSGADIANVCNEAALVAARKKKQAIEMIDFEQAIERIIGGLEKKERILSREERTRVAYHEAGHAVTGWFLEHSNPLLKVSIVPRGVAALGYAQYQPIEHRIYTVDQLLDRMCVLIGGRAAEAIVFNKITTGARDDLQKITKLAYDQVRLFGMNEKIGTLSYPDDTSDENMLGHKLYSQATAKLIDEEVRKLITAAYSRTEALLKEKREGLEKVAKRLLKQEILHAEDLEELLGKRPWAHKSTFEELTDTQVQHPPAAAPSAAAAEHTPAPPEHDTPSPSLA